MLNSHLFGGRPEAMLCRACEQQNREGSKYCLRCGARLAASCSACGEALPEGAGFCDSCGARVEDLAARGAVQQGPVAAIAPAPINRESSTPVRHASPPKEGGPSLDAGQATEAIEFLGKLSIFKGLKAEVLQLLVGHLRVVRFGQGPVFKENDPVDGLYIIKSGNAKVTKGGAGAAAAVLALLKKGDNFGEIGLIDGLPRPADVSAMQPLECYFLRRDVFNTVLEGHPELALSMIRAFAAMVRNANAWVGRSV